MEPIQEYDVAVVGAGASGLMCAWQCARRGRRVVLLEKAAQPGRKILVSGNGRCNFTNAFVSKSDYRGTPELAAAVLQHFSFQDCLQVFQSLGVISHQEGLGRVFPLSGKSTAVADSLRLACQEAGVTFLLNSETTHIRKQKSFFLLTQSDGAQIRAARCVLACGSCAYPQAGGTQAGYQLAKSLGHHIVPPTPSLSALNIKEKAVARLQGIRVQGWLRARCSAGEIQSQGEILFTNYGLSGPAALSLSGFIGKALPNGSVVVTVDMLPDIADKQQFITDRIKQFPARTPKAFFAGVLHENIANLLIDFAGLRKNLPVSSWTENTQKSVANTLAAWPFTVTSLRPWTEAMVAAGGVNCAEINYNTFESLCCPGLYLIGELLNVDGRSGGFNLHFAWGSAWVAASAITKE